ncbi:FKBP-type peptidyl-prolyl cis-trans isomerase [Halomarina pelagica]|uniref:FKBP-type peptidyl-prolyl cis-trans isomerase n=1 Tax=Halomarina pelagica TaxID=2961599 RepID=UPI0020C38918|nr:peptidylprolyl isomerase [Halomarina sp. BND7]
MSDEPDEEVAEREETEQEAVDEQETDAEQEEVEEEEAETEGVQDGDFVRLAYTARTVEGDQLVDTTDEEVAEEEGIDTEQREFEPRVVVLGAGHIFEAVEEDVVGKEVGDSGSVTVPAAEAFGEYDQENVRTVSAEKIPEDDRYPGAQVNVDGQQGYLETIIGGRARVDFNHPLAGEDIEYDYEVVGVVEDKLERAKGLFDMYLDADLEMDIRTDEVEEEQLVEPDEDEESEEDEEAEPEFETVTVEKETLYVEASPQLSFNQQWMFQKQQIAQQIMDQVDLDRVIIQETIDNAAAGMGGLGGMMGGMGGAGGAGGADLEAALEEADVDADDIVDELDEE